MLCFHDDSCMLKEIAQLAQLGQYEELKAHDIVRLLSNYGTQRLVIIVDQAFDEGFGETYFSDDTCRSIIFCYRLSRIMVITHAQ